MPIICKPNHLNPNHSNPQIIEMSNASSMLNFIHSLSSSSELKPQYVEQQPSVTNMNELPHLLQAILQIKQNVFTTGGQQYQHQRTRKCHPNDNNKQFHSIRLFVRFAFTFHSFDLYALVVYVCLLC